MQAVLGYRKSEVEMRVQRPRKSCVNIACEMDKKNIENFRANRREDFAVNGVQGDSLLVSLRQRKEEF